MVVGSILVWAVCAIALFGARNASIVNLVATISKLVPILIFIVLMVVLFKFSSFAVNFWTVGKAASPGGFDLGNVMPQVKSTMMMTLWVFMGLEGAVVISGRAKSQKIVRKATLIAFIGILAVYALVSLLPLGTFSQAQLAAMPETGSMAVAMLDTVGQWGSVLVNVGIIISVIGSWLAWMIELGEMPATAAKRGTFPKGMAKENRFHAPYVALLVTAGIIEVFYLLTFVAANPWAVMVSITSVMALPAYLFCTLYLVKLSAGPSYPSGAHTNRRLALVTGSLGSIYGLWMIYAAGLNYLLMACIIYAIGVPIYAVARKRTGQLDGIVSDDVSRGHPVIFRRFEKVIFALIVVLGISGVVYTVFNWSTLV
jgi:arginine:ornithine antiporter/lysine permease